LDQLQHLLDQHSFWARGRSRGELARMLAGSQAVVSAWHGQRLVVFRAVLWDVVVAGDAQGQGLGRRLVEALLASPALASTERVYLMTTNGAGFYKQLGFETKGSQHLMLLHRP
jgi:N-acetylglutamate synthase-like GNAT family acetyltransferase